ncbi:hypothetical protein U1Q18_001552 [Sarracenia purpurea var. burkii]
MQVSMAAETMGEEDQQQQKKCRTRSTTGAIFMTRLVSRRTTWVCLFVVVYTILVSSSWNILKSVLSWYETNASVTTSAAPTSSFGWPALYAAVVLGAVFGLLAMAAALAVAVPATVVTWITVLVLLAFSGKPRRALVVEAKKLTAEISGFVIKILMKEGNAVAAVCALLGYFALVRRSREEIGSS